MASEFGESATRRKASLGRPTWSGNSSNEVGDFECFICLDLAQDPVVTLCGHLFCWPCLYKWLHRHSHSQECPVCKALVQEEKVVPLYGKGKAQTHPRTKSYPGFEIPHRPMGQMPQTDHLEPDSFGNWEFIPRPASIDDFIFSSSRLDVQFHHFFGATVYGNGTTSAYRSGFYSLTGREQHIDWVNVLKTLLSMIFMVLLYYTVIFGW